MSSGAQRQYAGSFVGTGSAFNIETVGFRPRFIQFFNVTGLTSGYWAEGMADGYLFKLINHGSAQHIYATTNGITPLHDGFTVGSDADLNTAGETVFFLCCE